MLFQPHPPYLVKRWHLCSYSLDLSGLLGWVSVTAQNVMLLKLALKNWYSFHLVLLLRAYACGDHTARWHVDRESQRNSSCFSPSSLNIPRLNGKHANEENRWPLHHPCLKATRWETLSENHLAGPSPSPDSWEMTIVYDYHCFISSTLGCYFMSQ